ncbi:nucleotide sugar dehydrogenase [Lutibaculum baratangense]|uniref:UDP-glucose 6-dehydrogenase n=1 Tax=Lutibaculum baratangense AMV1 TaxID=631454 RepID=V4RCE6_9HYPH|nr:nucleotide sugar dehydrogenase [Lutibaculum baratangense]ESR23064.1 GDP-mannose 6-dehydrogenase [Lutibaculum baratangense AMV1]
MKVCIFGLGYVGSTAAACIASQGHRVVGIDISPEKVDAINQGRAPIVEPHVDRLMAEAHQAGRIRATTEVGAELRDADVAIVCVGTPSAPDGSHNMSYVVQVTSQIATALSAGHERPITIAYRSTMRPGTTQTLIAPILRTRLGAGFEDRVELIYNPEFLRETTAVEDYFHPPKIVIGTMDGEPSPVMTALHSGIQAPLFNVPIAEAELTKFVDNTWHAVKVTFANEIGRLCQRLGVSAGSMYQIFVSDTKLNISPYYLRPGDAFGGSCLPKDVRALQYIASDIDANTPLIDAVMRSNDAHKNFQYTRIANGLPKGSKILLVGLAFKDGTDDLRESPSVDLARKLLNNGYQLNIYDPWVTPEKLIGHNLGYAYTQLPALEGLLVDKAAAEEQHYDLIVAANRKMPHLNTNGTPIVHAGVI